MSTESLKQEEFKNFKEKIESLRAQIQNEGEQFIVRNFKKIFSKHPYLKEVTWTGYTPYYRDGEECYYSSQHTSPDIYGDDCSYGTNRFLAIRADISAFMSLIDDNLMLDLFGDHVRITVTKEGLAVEEYEHG